MDWSNLVAAGAQVGLVSDILRWISMFLDVIVYSLIPIFFNMIYDIYEISGNIGSSEALSTIRSSIYSLLAIIMFFKLAFSLLAMLADPDLISNKEKGAGKLLSSVVICIVLIVVMPMIFDFASEAQSKIMDNHLIEKAVYGSDFGSEGFDLGRQISVSTLSIFMTLTVDSGNGYDAYMEVFNNEEEYVSFWNLFTYINTTTNATWTTVLFNAISLVNPAVTVDRFITKLFGEGNRYQISYIVFVSTIVGIVILWSVVKLVIDIAYRSIKFFALQLLSPIAIVSTVDPKSSKSGVFSKWLSETLKTYLSLFVRIFALAIGCLVIKNIGDLTEIADKPLERLSFILAAVAFIKTAPKFIDKIFGTEISKDSDTKFAADLLKQGLGAAGAGTIGGALGIASAKKLGYNPGRGLWEGLKSGASGGWQSAKKNDAFGFVKAANGANAVRKYYGLGTMAEARKQAAEADRQKKAAEAFSDVKDKISYKNIDDMTLTGTDPTKSFDAYIRQQAATRNPNQVAWATRWAAATTDAEREKIKKEYANEAFNTITGKKYENIMDNLSESRQAAFKSSVGASTAIESQFTNPKSDIRKAWLDEESWEREKIIAEQQVENWGNLVERANASHGSLYSDSNVPNVYYDSKADLMNSKGITQQITSHAGVNYDTYKYGGTSYTSLEEALDAVNGVSAGTSKINSTSMAVFQSERDVAKERVNYASKKKEKSVNKKAEAKKVPANAAEARKADLIDIGTKRGY